MVWFAVWAVPLAASATVTPTTSYNGAYTVTWTDASGGGVRAYLAQSLNGGAWTKTTVTGTYSKAYSGMALGSYSYKLQIYDYDTETRKEVFSYETNLGSVLVTTLTAPTAPGALTGPTTNGSGAITIAWGAATPAITSYELWENGTRVYSGTGLSSDLTGRKDGTYSYTARACNGAGCGPYTAPFVVTVDIMLSEVVPDGAAPVLPTVPALAPAGALPGAPSADGGAGGYRIDIELPPGRTGVQPSVALAYSSKGGNGVAGVGWSLSAVRSIYRCPRILEVDGENRPVLMTNEDKLCMDGSRLVVVSGSYGRAGSEYRTEIDPFARITLNGDMASGGSWFKVEEKSGRIVRFVNVGGGSAGPAANTWRIADERDRQGNCIQYAYTRFATAAGGLDEEYVLGTISYTGTGSDAGCVVGTDARKVSFTYSGSREDKRTTYSAGRASMSTALLTGITSWVGNAAVLQYDLTYKKSAATRRSLLTAVGKCAASGCANGAVYPTTFAYQEDTPFIGTGSQQFDDPTAPGTTADQSWSAWLGQDFDGDGKRDLFMERSYPASSAIVFSALGPVVSPTSWSPFTTDSSPADVVEAIDVDQDGRADLVRENENGQVEFLSPLTGVTRLGVNESGAIIILPAGSLVSGVDYDGDGLIDVTYYRSDMGNFEMLLKRLPSTDCPGTCTPRFSSTAIAIPMDDATSGPSTQRVSMTADLNGDGYVDQYREGIPEVGGHSGIVFYLGGNSFVSKYDAASLGWAPTGSLVPPGVNRRWADVNGDGLRDQFSLTSNILWLNRGGPTTSPIFEQVPISGIVDGDSGTPLTIDNVHQVASFAMDVDADGADELMVPAERSGPEYCFYESIGQGEFDWFCADERGFLVPSDRSFYRWDAYKVLDRGDGTYWLVRVRTGLVAPANVSSDPSDHDGDGMPDLAFRIAKSSTTSTISGLTHVNAYYVGMADSEMGPRLARNGSRAPDLLVSATNGMGATARWSYLPLSAKAQPASSSCDPAAPFYTVHHTDQRSPGYVYFTSSMWAVSEFAVSHGVVGASTTLAPTCYRYEDAMLNVRGRGFQGFKKIIVEERLAPAIGEATAGALSANNRRTTTTFLQEFPFTNRVKDVTVELSSGGVLSTSKNWWFAQLTGTSSLTGPWIVFPTGTIEEKFDLPAAGGVKLSTTTTVNEVDAVSGESKRGCKLTADLATAGRTALWSGLPTSVSAAEKVASWYTQEARDIQNVTATWWLGRVASSESLQDFASASMPSFPTGVDPSDPRPRSLTSTGGNSPFACPTVNPSAFARRKKVVLDPYDDASAAGYRRQPHTQTLKSFVGTNEVTEATTTYASYDQFGNPTSSSVTAKDFVDGLGNLRPMPTTYTPTADGYFIQSEQNPAGHVITRTISPAWGKATYVQQVQYGPATTVVLDGLGRVDYTQADGTQPVYERTLAYGHPSWNSACNPAVLQVWTVQAGSPTRIACLDALGRTTASVTDAFDGPGSTPAQVIAATDYNERGAKVTEYAPRLTTDTTRFGKTYSGFDALGRATVKTESRDPALFASGAGLATLVTNYTHTAFSTDIVVQGATGGVGPLRMSRTFDARGKLVDTTQDVKAAGASTTHTIQTRYLYDGAGIVTHIVDSAGNDLQANYDSLGRKTLTSDPDRGAWTYRWDGLGRLLGQTDAKGNVTTNDYDLVGRPIYRIVTSGANGATALQSYWEWDAGNQKGVLANEHDSNGFRKDYKYDALLRPYEVRTTLPASDARQTSGTRLFVTKYGYDRQFGRLKAKGLPGLVNPAGETVLLEYTSHGFPLGETEYKGAPGKQYRRVRSMSAQGQVTRQTLGNCLDELSQFDGSRGLMLYQNAARPAGLSSLPADLASCPTGSVGLRQEEYAYEQYLNLARTTKNVPSLSLQATEDYTYDELQRLRSSTRKWTGTGARASPTTESESYTYDDLGNITSKSNYGSAYAYGSKARTTGNAGPHAALSVTMTDASVASFSYDANGNLVDGDGRHVDFDVMDRPTHVCTGPVGTCEAVGAKSDFAYAPDGSRYRQVIQQPGDARWAQRTVYYLDKDYELWVWGTAPSTSGPVEERTYVGASAVVYLKEGGQREVRYQTFDRLGSVEAVTKDDVQASPLSIDGHGFDPFGKPRGEDFYSSSDRLHPTGDLGATTDRGFTGHEHLDPHYLIHMNGRVYDYRLGRFLSVDPIISNPASSQSINPYSYIGNNPLSGTDPTGYCEVQTGSHVCGAETIGNLTVNGTSNVVLSNAGKDAAKGNGAPGQQATPGCKDGASCGAPSETGQKKEPGQTTTPGGGSTAPEAKKDPVDKKAAKAAYGETEGLKPRRGADGKVDPESKEELTEARAAVAEISRRNKNVHSKDGSQAKDPDSKEAWKDSTEASGRDAKLPKDVRHFFLRQDGVGRQAPDWSGDKAPFKSFGPFINSGGGDVPRGDSTYIDLYQGVK